jgi:hypothetical protein
MYVTPLQNASPPGAGIDLVKHLQETLHHKENEILEINMKCIQLLPSFAGRREQNLQKSTNREFQRLWTIFLAIGTQECCEFSDGRSSS